MKVILFVGRKSASDELWSFSTPSMAFGDWRLEIQHLL